MVLAAITSVLQFPLFSNEILLKASDTNGLRVDSILRCDRIMIRLAGVFSPNYFLRTITVEIFLNN